MLKESIFLSLAIIILSYTSCKAADERCINVPVKKNFDAQKILGSWYAQEIGDDNEGTKRCLYYTTTYKDNTFYIQRIYTKSGRRTAEPYKMYQMKNTSEFQIEWNGKIRSLWSIGADYNLWSAWYACFPERDDRGILFLSTRKRIPDKGVMEKAREAARSAGFELSEPYIKRVNQSNCE